MPLIFKHPRRRLQPADLKFRIHGMGDDIGGQQQIIAAGVLEHRGIDHGKFFLRGIEICGRVADILGDFAVEQGRREFLHPGANGLQGMPGVRADDIRQAEIQQTLRAIDQAHIHLAQHAQFVHADRGPGGILDIRDRHEQDDLIVLPAAFPQVIHSIGGTEPGFRANPRGTEQFRVDIIPHNLTPACPIIPGGNMIRIHQTCGTIRINALQRLPIPLGHGNPLIGIDQIRLIHVVIGQKIPMFPQDLGIRDQFRLQFPIPPPLEGQPFRQRLRHRRRRPFYVSHRFRVGRHPIHHQHAVLIRQFHEHDGIGISFFTHQRIEAQFA